jgi:xylulokinase
MALLLGIDIGTSGTRAILVESGTGDIVAAGTAEYPLFTPRPLWAEQNPHDWWQGTVAAVRKATATYAEKTGYNPEIAAIGLSGQMHGVVLLDEHLEPLGNALIWCDGRTEAECTEITARVGAEKLVEITGNVATVGMSAPKLLWVRRNLPDAWAKARHFLLPKDYIRYKLTGELAGEVSDASGTLLFDVPNRRWSQEILDALEITASMLPPVHESPVVSAYTNTAGATECGIAAGIPVVGGGADQAAGAVGNGIVTPGLVSSTIGSSGVVFAYADKPVLDPLGRLNAFCGSVPGSWFVMGVTQAAGLSLRWLRDELAHAERQQAATSGRDVYELLMETAGNAPPGSEGLYFLPYLMGERTPHLDPQARGGWIGLTAAHRWAHLVRSVLEGVTFSLRDCLTLIEELGLPVEEVRLSGGGARSAFWRQMQTDVFGRNVVTLNSTEGPAYGAALLAGVGAGVWTDVPSACSATLRQAEQLAPDAAQVALYRESYTHYRRLYPALKRL